MRRLNLSRRIPLVDPEDGCSALSDDRSVVHSSSKYAFEDEGLDGPLEPFRLSTSEPIVSLPPAVSAPPPLPSPSDDAQWGEWKIPKPEDNVVISEAAQTVTFLDATESMSMTPLRFRQMSHALGLGIDLGNLIVLLNPPRYPLLSSLCVKPLRTLGDGPIPTTGHSCSVWKKKSFVDTMFLLLGRTPLPSLPPRSYSGKRRWVHTPLSLWMIPCFLSRKVHQNLFVEEA